VKPLIHAKISVKRHGGVIEDYIDIHNFIDQTKAAMPDVRHRAILHSSFGCYLAEQVFGVYKTNAEGKDFSVRDIAEEHIQDDLGTIPTIERWLRNLPLEPWMSGAHKRTKQENVD